MIEREIRATAVDGALFQPLRVIPAQGGDVLHGLRPGYALWPKAGFGEIYFSEVLPGCVKAWKLHKRQTQLFIVPRGLVLVVMFDDRPSSPTRGCLVEEWLGRPDNYGLLKIPPGVWHGFASRGGPALVCNCADMPHDPEESASLPPENDLIPYRWNLDRLK